MQMNYGKSKSAGSQKTCMQYCKIVEHPQRLILEVFSNLNDSVITLFPVSTGMQTQWRGQDLLTLGEERVHLKQSEATCAWRFFGY